MKFRTQLVILCLFYANLWAQPIEESTIFEGLACTKAQLMMRDLNTDSVLSTHEIDCNLFAVVKDHVTEAEKVEQLILGDCQELATTYPNFRFSLKGANAKTVNAVFRFLCADTYSHAVLLIGEASYLLRVDDTISGPVSEAIKDATE